MYDSSLEAGQYKATERLRAECSPAAASQLVNLITEVDGTILIAKATVFDEQQQELRTAAVRGAMSEARAIAEAITAAENLKLTGVSHVQRPPANEADDPMDSLGDPPGYIFDAHKITIKERFTVTYDIDKGSSTR